MNPEPVNGYLTLLSILEIGPIRGVDMDQNDSTDDKKPKKKRVSDKVYYAI